MSIQVVYNAQWSTKEHQEQLHSLLPLYHEYGDLRSVLSDGSYLHSCEAHNQYCSNELRIKTRKRCTVIDDVIATHSGNFNNRKVLPRPYALSLVFFAVPDWQGTNLDVETLYLKMDQNKMLPQIGPYSFNFLMYVSSMYEDLLMCLESMRTLALQKQVKMHLKIVPLGIGHSIKTRFGDYLSPTILPAYLMSLQFACMTVIHESWIDTLEFVDHNHGSVSPMYQNKTIKIIKSASRDAFDFAGSVGHPAILAPCDAFEKLCGLPNSKHLASTLANNSDLRSVLEKNSIEFVPWNQTT